MKRSVLILAIVLSLATAALAADTGYPQPDVSKAKLILEEKQIVVVTEGRKATEVDIKTYKEPDGRLVRSYSIGGTVFRYDIDTNGVEPYEYRIIDTEGNGIFDKKEQMVGEIDVQGKKGQQYYIDLGPEAGKEYKYNWERDTKPSIREEKDRLMGYPIYIPQWVVKRFVNP